MATIGRGLSSPLVTINFILYLISACLAGWVLNRNINASAGTGETAVGNEVTQWFVPLALVASVVGMASTLMGTHHLRVWRVDSLSAAAAASLIAWLLTLLAMGVGCKEIHVGGFRPKRLKVVEALMIVLSLFELLYFLSLHAGELGADYGPTTATRSTGLKGGNDYGTPAASAV